jgi:hypothetical protein
MTPNTEPTGFAELVEDIVKMANCNAELNDGTTEPIKRIIADNDLVFAVWQNPSAPHCVDLLAIKGLHILAESGRYNIPIKTKLSAVLVDNIEMAIATCRVLGDGDEGPPLQ